MAYMHSALYAIARPSVRWRGRKTLHNLIQSVRPSVCLPVCPSVTRAYRRKTVEVRIMKFLLYGSHIWAFHWHQDRWPWM